MNESNLNLNDDSSVKSDTKGRSRLEQASILLLSIGEEAAAMVMQQLSREEVVCVSQMMSRLHNIKLDQARQALDDFFQDYREQSGINGASRSYLQAILNKALGSDIAKSVINGIYGDEIRHRMTRLQWVDTPQLVALIDQEHLQLQAVFLAFYPLMWPPRYWRIWIKIVRTISCTALPSLMMSIVMWWMSWTG